MGQYWLPVNLDKKEFIVPHQLGAGLKLWEQIANHPGPGTALLILCAAMREHRGGGDFDLTENWHGPERKFPEHNTEPAPMPEDYQAIAHRTIGRWAGDRIALVGDYAEDSDLAPEHKASQIYGACNDDESIIDELIDLADEADKVETKEAAGALLARVKFLVENRYRDITADVRRVIEHELRGHFEGDGWATFVDDRKDAKV